MGNADDSPWVSLQTGAFPLFHLQISSDILTPPAGRAPIRMGLAARVQVPAHARREWPCLWGTTMPRHKEKYSVGASPRTSAHRSTKTIVRAFSRIVRSMVARQPFNTWSLHVKLFTEEAVNYWNASERLPNVPPLPPGLMYSIELEGVDGKSGHPGSGREGPMAADDGEHWLNKVRFRSSILMGYTICLR